MGGGSTELSVESFGCGGLLGAVLGFLCAIRKTAGDMWPAVAVAALRLYSLAALPQSTVTGFGSGSPVSFGGSGGSSVPLA